MGIGPSIRAGPTDSTRLLSETIPATSPGPKFDYKLAWFERLIAHARGLSSGDFPVVLAGDYNVVPTDFDIYDMKSWKKDALLQPESRAAYQRLLAQGWTDALRTRHPGQQIFTFWDYFRQRQRPRPHVDHLRHRGPHEGDHARHDRRAAHRARRRGPCQEDRQEGRRQKSRPGPGHAHPGEEVRVA